MFNGRTSAFQADDASSILATRSIAKEKYLHGQIAQSVEHFLGKEEVTGSNPVVGSIWYGPATAWRCVQEVTKVAVTCQRR